MDPPCQSSRFLALLAAGLGLAELVGTGGALEEGQLDARGAVNKTALTQLGFVVGASVKP